MSASCIYEGSVRHRRFEPEREFSYPLAMAYVDLDELPELLGGRLVAPLARHRALSPPRLPRAIRIVPLADAVRDVVEDRTGARPAGPIRLLTQLRSFGHCFNPVSFYYCFEPAGERVEAVVAEVTNTPWGERHAYVCCRAQAAALRCSPAIRAKELHVSPFMGMDHRYEARAATPAQTLSVHISSSRASVTVFDATLALRRRELTRASMARITVRYPLATVRVLALIYGHAIGLNCRRPWPVHPPPQARDAHDDCLFWLVCSLLLRRIKVGSLIVVDGRAGGLRAPAAPATGRVAARLAHAAARQPRNGRRLRQGLWDSPDLVALIRLRRAQRGPDRPAPLAERPCGPLQRVRALFAATRAPAPARHRRALRPRQRAVLADARPDDDATRPPTSKNRA